jgi:hypothetical protein
MTPNDECENCGPFPEQATPQETIANRSADSVGGLAAIGHMIALRNFATESKAYHARLLAGDKLQMRTATRGGMEAGDFDDLVRPHYDWCDDSEEGSSVGDQFSIQGDQYHYHQTRNITPQTAPDDASAAAAAPVPKKTSLLKKLLLGSGLAATLLGGGGLGGAWIMNALLDTEYEVRFYDADGNLIDVPDITQRPIKKE